MTEDNHWQLIQLAEFERPAAPASTRVQQFAQHIRSLFPKSDDVDESNDNDDFPGYREFDMQPAVAALDDAWQDWLKTDDPGVKFLISPPYSGTANIARSWAEQHQWPRLHEPTTDLLGGVHVDDWWQPQASKHWIIDNLADYWQRHTHGLAFIRTLLPKLIRGELGQGVVVCDSWSFAFLQRAWPASLPNVYCFAGANEKLLAQVGIQAEAKKLKALAARAFGNVGLALALWSVERDPDNHLPSIPSNCGDATAFVLYALLLHNGLPGQRLQQVLPTLAADQLDVQLLQLQQARLVECKDEQWQVTVYGYLAVRDFLKSRGYFVDAF